jgi:hypothetical protein
VRCESEQQAVTEALDGSRTTIDGKPEVELFGARSTVSANPGRVELALKFQRGSTLSAEVIVTARALSAKRMRLEVRRHCRRLTARTVVDAARPVWRHAARIATARTARTEGRITRPGRTASTACARAAGCSKAPRARAARRTNATCRSSSAYSPGARKAAGATSARSAT